jgi:hypothetical protein
MILLYLQTEAVRTRSREVELGRSMNRWLTAMGVNNGGKGYSLVREQSWRLSLCRLTFFSTSDEGRQITNGSFVRNTILPCRPDDASTQLSLWRERVVLDEAFYSSLVEHPLPVRETAIRACSPQHGDRYLRLARLQAVAAEEAEADSLAGVLRPVRRWLHTPAAFRQHVKEPLALALAAYPEARVEVDDDAGVTLHPSAPPVPERRLLPVR